LLTEENRTHILKNVGTVVKRDRHKKKVKIIPFNTTKNPIHLTDPNSPHIVSAIYGRETEPNK
jgi:hypothetical protein